MDDKTKILLEVDIPTSEPVKNITELKKAVAALREEQKQLKDAGAENSEEYVVLEQKIKALNTAIADNTRTLQADVKEAANAEGSYNALSAQLTKLKQAYHAAASDEEREAILQNLSQVDKKLKELDAAQGVYTRNVGNYASAFGGLGAAVDKLKVPLNTLKASFTALATHPFIAIVGVLVVTFQKIAERIKENKAAMEALTVAFSAFNGIGTMIDRLIDKIAQGLGWLGEQITKIVKKLGLWSEAMQAAQEISKEEIAIQEQQRKVSRQVAENEQKIAELRTQAAEKDKRSARERLELLQQASDLELANAQSQFDLAKRKYELQVKMNAQSNSSQEDLNKENDLYIEMVRTQTNLANRQRELASQMVEARKSIAAEADAAAQAASKAAEEEMKRMEQLDAAERARLKTLIDIRKQEESEEEQYLEKQQQVRRKYKLTGLTDLQEELIAFIESEDYKLLTVEERERVKADIRAKYAKQAADAEKEAAEQSYKTAMDTISQILDFMQQAASVISSVAGIIEEQENAEMDRYEQQQENKKEILKARLDSGVISQENYEAQVQALNAETDKKQKELQLKQAKRQKAMAIMNATLAAAQAIIASLAQSPVAIGPFPNPAGIASLALATATGAAQIAVAAATPLPTAGKGMLIEGNDHQHGGVLINAEGGEAIINKKATRRFLPLLSQINQSTGGIPLYGNGGIIGQATQAAESMIDYDRLAQACARIKTYVAVTDINDAQARAARVEQLREF